MYYTTEWKNFLLYNIRMSSPSPWVPRPRALTSEPGWAHVFRLQLDLPAGRLAALAGWLSEDEQARAERFLREIDRQRFIAARGQMRAILAGYRGADPAALRFAYNPQGKPYLPEGEPRFNLSHSQDVGLLAVAFGQEVGVDVERLDREVDYAGIARRFFAPAEVDQFFRFSAETRPLAFCTGWARKEAFIKARGMGMAFALDGFVVSLDPDARTPLPAPEPGWTLHTLEAIPGYAAALAVEGEIDGIRCWAENAD